MPLLELDGVSKSYWRGRHEVRVLDAVSFDVDPGELVALFGERASGKTTLLRIACGIEQPDGGAVRFAGRPLTSGRRSARVSGVPRGIGWMRRAGPSIPAMEMLDYVALPLLGVVNRREAHQRASGALVEVGAKELATAKWGDLSDAERTLVSLAQAAAHEPALLLADEPTASLTVAERETVLVLLRSAAEQRGTAILMTVPDVPEMLRAHRVMSLSDGELIRPTRHGAEVIDFPLGRGRAS